MSHPLLCRISGRDGGGAFDGHQLGPDQVPVIRAKVPAAYCAGGGLLDLRASLNGDWSLTAFPLPNSGAGNTKNGRKRGGRADAFNRALDRGGQCDICHAHD